MGEVSGNRLHSGIKSERLTGPVSPLTPRFLQGKITVLRAELTSARAKELRLRTAIERREKTLLRLEAEYVASAQANERIQSRPYR